MMGDTPSEPGTDEFGTVVAGILFPELRTQHVVHEIGLCICPRCRRISRLTFLTGVVPKGGAGDQGTDVPGRQ